MTYHTAQYFINRGFIKYVEDLKKKGVTESDIAKKFFGDTESPLGVSELRQTIVIAKSEILDEERNMVRGRHLQGMSVADIAKEVEITESSVLHFISTDEA